MFIYLVQEEIDGIPDEPVAFWSEEKADEYFIRLVNEHRAKDTLKLWDIESATDYIMSHWGEWGVRSFIVRVPNRESEDAKKKERPNARSTRAAGTDDATDRAKTRRETQ